MNEKKPNVLKVKKNDPELDWFILICGSALLAIIVLSMILEPESSLLIINHAFTVITRDFGIIYILLLNAIIVFLTYLTLSKKGSIKLGPEGAKKDYSNFSWIAMLFCTGIGAAVIYWGATEWTFYYANSPQIAHEDQAILWAASYGAYHWGPLTWSLYALTTVAFGVS
jgi:BCCT family betaine/carnitine transporter